MNETTYRRGPRHESRATVHYVDALIPPRPAGPAPAAPRRVNVDRILARVVAPALGVATIAFGLWAGLVSA